MLKPVVIPKFDLKIMVCGGISRYGKTRLCIVPKSQTVTGNYYREHILPEYIRILKDRRIVPKQQHALLMQDGATCHTAVKTMNQIKASGVQVLEKWPGNSPDLNPIEHVWAKLQDSVFIEPRPKNLEQLIARTQKTWEELRQDEIASLTDSFGRRLLECQANSGNHTKY